MGLTITGGIIFIGGVELIATSSPGPSPSGNAWEISTATFTTSSNVATSPTGLFLSDDGTYLYIISDSDDTVYQYSVSSAYDVGNITINTTYSSANINASPTGIAFNADGSTMYITGNSGTSDVRQFGLTTDWDISTGYYTASSNITYTGETQLDCIQFSNNGSNIYILGDARDTIYQTPLSKSWTLASIEPFPLFSVSTNETGPFDIFFSSDGGNFYIVGATDSVSQFSISEPWKIGTSSYYGNFSIVAQETVAYGLAFSNDGSNMYIVGSTSDTVYQYSLGTAWDVTTAAYSNLSFSVASQEANSNAIRFSSTGTNMYIMGTSGDDVNQYSLSTPWNISTASYQKVFSVQAQDNDPRGLDFSSDGSVMFTFGATSDAVYQYNLGTAWDVGTASYSGNSFSQPGISDLAPSGIFFKPNGSVMFLIGSSNDQVQEYNLTSPYDLTSVINLPAFSVSAQDSIPRDFKFNDDGSKIFVLGSSSDSIYQYSLSTPYSISTSVYSSLSFNISAQSTNTQGITFKTDGTKMYIVDSSSDRVFQYSLSTAWNISTCTYDGIFLSVAAGDASCDGITFSTDGTKLYLPGAFSERIVQYQLSVAWDISSATLQSPYALPFLNPTSITFNNDGTKMYVADSQELIVEYNLGAAWDVTTATYEPIYIISQDSLPTGIAFNTDGTKMYIVGQTNSSVYEYNLGIAFSIVSASYVQSFSIVAQETLPTGISFKTDGTEMYIIGSDGDSIYQYNLSVAWDISTASYQSTLSIAEQDNNPHGIVFKPDGTKIYFAGKQNNKVYEFSTDSNLE